MQRSVSRRPVRSLVWSFRVWPAWLCTLLILVVGSIPQGPPGAQRLNDKALHFIGFGITAWLWCRAFRLLTPRASLRSAALRGGLVSAGLGALLELWQAFLPYRSAELLDLVADVLGALLAAWLTAAYWRRAERGAGRS